MNTKLFAVIFAVFSIQGSLASNATAGTPLTGTGNTGITPATCASTTGSFANCALCDNGNSQTFCTACNPGYTLTAQATGAYPTLCTTACNANCLYCSGAQTPKGSQAVAADTVAGTGGGAGSTVLPGSCQIENQPIASSITQAQAFCKPVTSAGVTTYSTPGAVTTGNFPCYACAIIGCVDCRLNTGTPTSSATANQCRQCMDGFYLDSNTTANSLTYGTACTACPTLPTIGTVTSTSGTFVVGTCNKCYSKTMCYNATCNKTTVSSSGQYSYDANSYTFDVSKQQCVSKSHASRLAVAFVGIIAVVFVSFF